MAQPAARPIPTFEKLCPAERYFGGLQRLYVCDARAVNLPRLYPAQPQPLPATVPMAGGLSLAELMHEREMARLDWTASRTAQGVLWQPTVELSLRPSRPDVVEYLMAALGMDLFVLAVPPRAGVVWAMAPLRLSLKHSTEEKLDADPLWRFTLSPAQVPANAWYRNAAPTLTNPTPGTNRGFSAGFSLGFR
jgi:hypothetical protein